jgi:hypothetical protein
MAKAKKMSRSRRTSTPGLSLSYSGPVRLSTRAGQDSKPVKVNLSYSFAVDSDGSGVVSNFLYGPGLVSSSDWSSYADVYQEYRVLAIAFDYMPYYNGAFSTVQAQGSGAINVVHTPLLGPPTSIDEVVQHVTWSPFRTSASCHKEWRMFGVEESPFSDVANVSSVNHGGITFFCDNLTASRGYGRGIVTYLVEFRGRK